jgi:pSer/pThr/pTyr-binding forkhead associated (FHA) protein
MPLWLCTRGADPYPLTPDVDVTIGRGQECELSVYSSLLSREHARIRWESEGPVLFDLGSLNGCYVGVDKVLRHALAAGDLIRLGDLLLQIVESGRPPPPLPSDVGEIEVEHGVEAPADDMPAATETRVFSRTSALHQQVFAYDELTWVQATLSPAALAAASEEALADPNLESWLARSASHVEVLWELLRTGVVAPTRPRQCGVEMSATQAAAASGITPRGEKLRRALSGKNTHWNEMASLRYRARQSAVFQALRRIARAYRPGGGLRGLDVPSLHYELTSIYAVNVPPDQIETEMRRLLALGVFSPRAGAGPRAWFPRAWESSLLEISPRGYAMLEGFRLEEDE